MSKLLFADFMVEKNTQLQTAVASIVGNIYWESFVNASTYYTNKKFHLAPDVTEINTKEIIYEDTVHLIASEIAKRKTIIKKFIYAGSGVLFDKVGDYIVRSGSGETYGVAEISPINSTLGDVTTPNTKTNGKTTATSTDEHTNVKDTTTAYDYSIKNNITQIFIDCIAPVIDELTTIY